jgi:hypothetical protein
MFKLKQPIFIVLILILVFYISGNIKGVYSDVAVKNYIKGKFYELNDNGAWSWFMDERAIVDREVLIVGSVRAAGAFKDKNKNGWGNIELSVFDLKNNKKKNIVLHKNLEQDDHCSPSLLVLPDGRYLAAYSKHSQEPKIYYRISKNPYNPFEWSPVVDQITPGKKTDWGGDNVTYCNLLRLSAKNNRLYLFHRGVGQDPNHLFSDNLGEAWSYGGRLYIGRDGYSPYTKYVSNGLDKIHFVATEDHPRKFNNSLYHGFIKNNEIYSSDGEIIGPLAASFNTTIDVTDLTQIYKGSSNAVAWITNIQLDSKDRPVVLFTVKVGDAGLPKGKGGMDHRFHYAKWNGKKWNEHEIAYAGSRLYPGEEDYTGLGAVDPQSTNTIYISTNADPVTGKPLISRTDGLRHHEIFRGVTSDNGKNWKWSAVTINSNVDNLRPIVPTYTDKKTILVWMRGIYKANRGEWTTKVVASILSPEDFKTVS